MEEERERRSWRLDALSAVAHLLPRGGGTFARVAWRLLGLGGKSWKKTYHGYWMKLDFALENQLSYWLGMYERSTERALRALLSPGALFIDAGANLGYFSLLAAQLVGPEGRVVAFEAEPSIAADLRANVEANPGYRVEVRAAAVGDRVGTAGFLSAPLTARSTLKGGRRDVSPGHAEHFLMPTEEMEVRMTTLDEDCLELARSWEGRVVLKMDIEGVEPLALAGAGGLLQVLDAAIVEIWAELLEWHGFGPEDVYEPFLRRGFRPFRLPEGRGGRPEPIDAPLPGPMNALFLREVDLLPGAG